MKKSSDCIYNISVQLSHADAAVWDIRQTSHLQMCEMNGCLKCTNLEQDSGYIEGQFECECHLSDPQHCGQAEPLAVKIEEKCEEPFAKILCDKEELQCETHTQRVAIPTRTQIHGWGVHTGTKDDKEDLMWKIIAEIIKPENRENTLLFL